MSQLLHLCLLGKIYMISRLYWSGKKLLQKNKQSFSYRITTHKKIYSTLLLKMKKQNDTFKLCFGFRLVFFLKKRNTMYTDN